MAKILVVKHDSLDSAPLSLVDDDRLKEMEHELTVVRSKSAVWDLLERCRYDLCVVEGVPKSDRDPAAAIEVTWADVYSLAGEFGVPTLVVMLSSKEHGAVYRILADYQEGLGLFEASESEEVCEVMQRILDHRCVETALAEMIGSRR